MSYIKNVKINTLLLFLILASIYSCKSSNKSDDSELNETESISSGAENLSEYLPLLRDKKVGILVNNTSQVGNTHLVDTLLSHGISIVKIFSPEHGFRGDVSDGLKIDNSIDAKTGIPIISLYGKNKIPTKEQLSNLDVVIYDIQDVGARFYTYISAMHYMMRTCADNNVKMILLDRPNPNGHYVDGPVLDTALSSYVGMHPIPIVYGMTAGELAQMIVGEKWLKTNNKLDLKIIKITNWNHKSRYNLPVKSSPNLPNAQAIALYPSLCLFEGTKVSVGRGTYDAFQIIGLPDSTFGSFSFTPISIPNMSKYPPYENQKCYGLNLKNLAVKDEINLSYLIDFFKINKSNGDFFNAYFKKLAGTHTLQKQIENGLSASDIRKTWKADLDVFKEKRKAYLLYEDFE